MKRELKFRAWLSDKYYVNPHMVYKHELVTEYAAIDVFYGKKMKLMRFSELKDENGQEIYEGDIVQTGSENPGDHEPMTGHVVMLDGSWLIVNEAKQEAIDLFSESASHKVIGNIYENPELMEEKQ